MKYQQETYESKKLGTTFIIMLGIYFYFLFRNTISLLCDIPDLIPEINQLEQPVPYALLYTSYFLWLVFGFASIILSLKCSNHAIVCLKLCLPYHFISFLFSSLPRLSQINANGSWLALGVVFFPLIFLLYICCSNEIHSTFPKVERKIGLPGTAGIILYAFLLLILVLLFASKYSARNHKIDIQELELYDGELSDGRIIFKPEDSWIQDSATVINSIYDAFYFHDPKIGSQICVIGAYEEYDPSRHYYIYSIAENQPFATEYFVNEIDFENKEDNDHIIYIDQYLYRKDSIDYYWTYASKIDKKLSKAIRVSIVDTGTLSTSISDADRILSNSMTNISERLLKKD